jgi:hypothetical protein
VLRLAEALADCSAPLLVVGDRKGPERFDLPGAEFYSLAQQQRLPFRLARQLPAGHYSRKNLGYLLAIARGARGIYETDDDNMPSADWKPRQLLTGAQAVAARPWMNVYRAFTDQHVWPRGFPLECLGDPGCHVYDPAAPVTAVAAPIQQGLADLAPDVDAVWRLALERELHFRRGPSLYLPAGTWCPFNSQSTWWFPAAYPLLYLPSHASFRMTDIWRGFVAQRCLWELGYGLVFHAAEVLQQRNPHHLLRDFKDEVPGYLHNGEIARRLAALDLRPGAGAVPDNLARCYECLVAGGFLPDSELPLVRAWLEDLDRIERSSTGWAARSAQPGLDLSPPWEASNAGGTRTVPGASSSAGRAAAAGPPCAVGQDDP